MSDLVGLSIWAADLGNDNSVWCFEAPVPRVWIETLPPVPVVGICPVPLGFGTALKPLGKTPDRIAGELREAVLETDAPNWHCRWLSGPWAGALGTEAVAFPWGAACSQGASNLQPGTQRTQLQQGKVWWPLKSSKIFCLAASKERALTEPVPSAASELLFS